MSEEKKPTSAGAEILVVDDTPASLRLLSEVLTGRGYRVRPASDGALALTWASSGRSEPRRSEPIRHRQEVNRLP